MCSGLRANSKNAEKYENKTLKWKNMIQLFHDPWPQKSIKIIFLTSCKQTKKQGTNQKKHLFMSEKVTKCRNGQKKSDKQAQRS